MSRTPPELNDTPCGFHAVDIPLHTNKGMSHQQPPQLTPESLFTEQAKIDALRLNTYNRLLGAVHQKIKATSTLPGSPQMTTYDVPEWQPGCPRFDVKDCILYIVWNLRHAGFQVLYVSPNRLLVSWKQQSVQYYQEESPIRQAMLAAASQKTGAQQQPTQPTAPTKKKAAAYRPATEGVAGLLAGGASSGRKGGANTVTFI
jgi:hypothetical protein